MWTLIGIAIVGFILYNVFKGHGNNKPKDKYYLVQERHTQVRNRIVKVPGTKRRSGH